MTHPALAPIYEIRQTTPNSVDGKWRRLITHLEIRRAQNGFVLMGFNAAPSPNFPDNDSRVCFVCESVESLCNTVAALASDTGDFAWGSCVDLPITNIFKENRSL